MTKLTGTQRSRLLTSIIFEPFEGKKLGNLPRVVADKSALTYARKQISASFVASCTMKSNFASDKGLQVRPMVMIAFDRGWTNWVLRGSLLIVIPGKIT